MPRRCRLGLDDDLFGDDTKDPDFEAGLEGDINEGKSYPILDHN
ncbi:hypothetical protein ACP4OV_014173 [Aristida adscensionis]